MTDDPAKTLLHRALPLLVRLGDFIGNGEVDPNRPNSGGERCDLILDIKRFLAGKRWRYVTMEESIAQCKREVLEMLAGPITTSRGVETVTPPNITSFSDLHTYCDANCLGWLCDEDVIFVLDGKPVDSITDNEGWMAFGNSLQNAVNDWIKAGGHYAAQQ